MKLVVIGGVAAGMSAASQARRRDRNLEITVFERGPEVSYGACGLPYFLEGRVRALRDLVVHTPEYFRKDRGIDVQTGVNVLQIAHARREVVLAAGWRVPYDRLILATGTRAIRPFDGAGVFTLHDLADGSLLKAYLKEKKPASAMVVGASALGLEAADAFRRLGLRVVIRERADHVLRRNEPALTALVKAHLEKHGVELHLSSEVREPAGLTLLAAGVKPNVELAREAGITIGRSGAIAVDEYLETNLRGVYAAGDCAEVRHMVTGRPMLIPLGTTANKTGRVAGANAAGARERFPGVVGTGVLSLFGTGIGFTGLSAAQARSEGIQAVSERIEAAAKPRYFRGKPVAVELVAERASGRVIGGTVTGEGDVKGRIDVIATAVTARMTVEQFEWLDLSYAPPFATAWDPLLIAAQQLAKKL